MSALWILLELRMMEEAVTTGSARCAKLQSNYQHQQTITQLHIGCMPFRHQTNTVKALKRNGVQKYLSRLADM